MPKLRIGILWRGDATRPAPEPAATRLAAIFQSLAGQGAEAVPVVFADSAVEAARSLLLTLDAVLVWVDPIMEGTGRAVLDILLADVASQGVLVSAHPGVIQRLGTKRVLYDTRAMSWGTDVRLYSTVTELASGLPETLDLGPRVLKQHRGNGGNGVWRVAWAAPRESVLLLHGLRGSAVAKAELGELPALFAPYFAAAGMLVDQPFQSRLGEGMIRCYLSGGQVVGFGEQMVTALLAPAEVGAEPEAPPPRLYYGAGQPRFQDVRGRMESEWIPELMHVLHLDADDLPVIWDIDLLHGERDGAGGERYVLCEINVSSVLPIPDEAVAPLAATAIRRARAHRAGRASQGT